ncbi:MAG: protein HflC [marine bacterium B5-7]|nr:MAG: protein HflC [marine bacterium B5-7]
MTMRQKTWAVIVVLMMLIMNMSLFTVREGQQALLLRLGKIVKVMGSDHARVEGPGLHLKWPLINSVMRFDTRLQTLMIQSSRILTSNKKDVIVDYYVKWRIANLVQYFKSTGGRKAVAENLLQQRLNDSLRAQFGRRNLQEVISDDRAEIMTILKKQANASAKDLGISVLDVRVKAIDLPEEVSGSVYSTMRAERQRVATQHRAQGRSEAEAIRANADAKSQVIVATAKNTSQQMRAQGDGLAATIYTKAYQKAPKFYAFYRSMQAYPHVFHENSLIVLGPRNDFLRRFNNINGKRKRKGKKAKADAKK